MNPFVLIGCAMALSSPAPSAPTIAVDLQTGSWNVLRVGGVNVLASPGIEAEIHWDGGVLPGRDQWKLLQAKRDGAGWTVVREAGPWRVTTVLAVTADDTIRRTVRFRWQGSGIATVRDTALRTPPLRLSPSGADWYCLPGNFPIRKRRFDSLQPGATVREVGWTRGDYALAVLHSPSAKRSVFVGYVFGRDQASLSVEEHLDEVCVVHRFDTVARLNPGDELECGTQVLRFAAGDEARAMEALGAFSDTLGNGPPEDQPERLKKMTLCEVHPWGRLESWGAGDRGNRYPRLTALLPYYQKLGITALWLLPVSWPPPWVYTLPAFDRVAPEDGTEKELRELVATAHERGIQVLIDLVVYGILPTSDEVKRLPGEVWCKDEAGNPVRVWGGTVLAADCSNPIWQKRIAAVVRHWAADFGFDGTRLDCIGWGQALNWADTRRANAPIAYGGLQLNKIIRDTMRAVNPDAVTLPEGGKPLVFRHADLVFDYPFYLALRDATRRPDLNAWIHDLRLWLEYERRCYPPRAAKGLVRFLELHDTVSAAEYFGVGPSQALMALCTFIQGTPLIQQEQETGYSKDLAAWLTLRNRLPCFFAGEADYLSVQCSAPGVLAFLRRSPGQAAVVAVNLTGASVRAELSWPRGLAQRLPAVGDALGNASLRASSGRASAHVTVPPFRPVVLLLQRKGTAPPAQSPTPPRRSTPQQQPDATGLVHVGRATRWFVETSEGRLEDAFNAQHARVRPGENATDILPVLRRAWNPLASGLLDGADRAAIGVVRADGEELRWTIDPRHAADVRIVDPAADGRDVTLALSPPSILDLQPRTPTEQCRVTPQFVDLQPGNYRLVLSRRHGGVPVLLAGPRGDTLIGADGDYYTDWGIVPNRTFASADGETNPRLTIDTHGGVMTATFRGVLRLRAWNGVQTCPQAAATVAYRLSYRCETGSDKLTITLGVTPSADLPRTSAFLALRLPLASSAEMEAGDRTASLSSSPGIRLGSKQALDLRFAHALLRTLQTDNLQNAFVIGNPDGTGSLFLCLLDGSPIDLAGGQEHASSVTLAIAPNDRAAPRAR